VRDTFGFVKVAIERRRLAPEPPPTAIIALSLPHATRRDADARPDAAARHSCSPSASRSTRGNTVYYRCRSSLPAGLETLHRKRPPVLSLAASVVVWLVFIVAPEHLSADAQSATFLIVAVPTLVALWHRGVRPNARLRPIRRRHATLRLTTRAPSFLPDAAGDSAPAFAVQAPSWRRYRH